MLFDIFTFFKYWDNLNIEIGGNYDNDLYSQNGNDENLDLKHDLRMAQGEKHRQKKHTFKMA